MVFVVLLCIGLFSFAILIFKAQSDKAKFAISNEILLNEKLSNITGLIKSINIVGQLSRYILVIDDINREIIYTDNSIIKRVNYSDIICVELIEDGNIVSSHSTTRTIGGTIVGGALLGVGGAVVGGLSGKTTTKKIITSLKVKILLNDVVNNNLMIDCFNYSSIIKNTDIEKDLIKYTSQAKQIVDVISVIIDKNKHKSNDESDKYVELRKLNSLKDDGIITVAEFEVQKSLLLNK